jgi:hypothetical protein
MADSVKISELTELTSGSLGDATIFPVVDGGVTKRASLSSLQSYLTDDLATDAELSSQISTVNSTISGLTTADITENPSNLYYTNARVTTHIGDLGVITSSQAVDALQIQNLNAAVLPILNANDVLSGSITVTSDDISDFDTAVSSAAADAGFGTGGGGGAGDIEGVTAGAGISGGGTTGTVTISLDTGSTHFTTGVSASAAAAGFGVGGGGGGSTDYISNITLSDSTLTFTGVGSAFNDSIDLAIGGADGGNLLTTNDIGNFVDLSAYQTDSASFASRIDAGGGGGATIPDGTVSSSAQTVDHLNEVGVISSSLQVQVVNADLTGLTLDDIGQGVTNRFYQDSLVLAYINSQQVISGSFTATTDLGGTGVISQSQQIANLGFIESSVFGIATESLQTQINGIEGISVNDQNTFLATQFFAEDIVITGSVRIQSGSGFFSGSGEQLFNIPASAIVGTLDISGSGISAGTNALEVDYATGINATINTGSFNVNGGDLIISGGAFSGSGAGLTDIPGSAIIGGVGGGTSIATGSVTASVDPTLGLIVNSNISASGNITAQSISVGTSGTPTIYSNNNLNLSASNAVVVTDSPFRLTPFTNATTASFSFSEGDLVYSADSDDFYGYRVIDGTGSLVSLTAGGSGTEVNWGQIIGIPNDLVSSSAQLGDLGVITSSAQLIPGTVGGDVLFVNSLGNITSSTDFSYTEGTGVLTAPSMSVGVLSYDSLSGPAQQTGSFNRVETDTLNINGAYELPTSDGTADQVIKTNGNGIATFGNVSWTQLEGLPDGIISSSGQFPDTVAYRTQNNDFIESQTITGSIFVSESVLVDTMVLVPRTTNPLNPLSGSIISSGSGNTIKPYFWDGNQWNALY